MRCQFNFDAMLNQKEGNRFSPIYHLAGFYTGSNPWRVYTKFNWFSDILILIVLSATVLQLIISPSEHKESLSVSFVVCISYSLALYYSLCFRLQHRKVSQLHSLFQQARQSLSQVVDESLMTETFQSVLKHSNYYSQFGAFVSFMSACLFSVQPLLRYAAVFGMDGSKRPQIDIWCPLDFQTPFVFEITVFLQFFTVFWVALRFFANDSFYMHMFRVNIGLFKLLTIYGERVVKYDNADENLPNPNIQRSPENFKVENKWNLKLLQPISEDLSGRIKLQMEPNEINILFYDEFSKQVEENLRFFIKNHQLILSCAQKSCQLYGPVMLMYLQALMGFAGVGAFGVLHTNGFEGPQSVAVSFFSVANLLCLYFMCVTGDDLSEKSGLVAKAMVHSPWYVCSHKVRSRLVLVVHRVNTRVQASVVGTPSFSLSCSMFAWFLKTLLSVYLFLVEVQKIKKS